MGVPHPRFIDARRERTPYKDVRKLAGQGLRRAFRRPAAKGWPQAEAGRIHRLCAPDRRPRMLWPVWSIRWAALKSTQNITVSPRLSYGPLSLPHTLLLLPSSNQFPDLQLPVCHRRLHPHHGGFGRSDVPRVRSRHFLCRRRGAFRVCRHWLAMWLAAA